MKESEPNDGTGTELEIVVKVKAFTAKQIEAVLPRRRKINQPQLDRINEIMLDPEVSATFKEQILSYADVLKSNAISISHYTNAVYFNSKLMLGASRVEAWRATFPDRYNRLLRLGKSVARIEASASAYMKSKVVVAILEYSLVPAYIMNAAYFQEALNTQVHIMRDIKISPKVRVDAADSVLKYTQMPESLRANGEEVASAGLGLIEKLTEATLELAKTQRVLIEDKVLTTNQVANTRIIDMESDDG